MTWIIAALCSAFFQCLLSETNRRYKISGAELNCARVFVGTLALLPIVVWLPWPTNPYFYLIAFISGAIGGLGMRYFFRISAQYNGRVANLYKPLRIFLMFSIWFCIDQSFRHNFLQDPWVMMGILGCMAIAISSVLIMRKNSIGWEAFLASVPVSIMFTISDVTVKLVIPWDMLVENIFVYVFISFFITACLETVNLTQQGKLKLVFLPSTLKAALVVGPLSLAVLFFAVMGFVLAPNPAYASMITLLVPVFLLVYHRIANIPDDASPLAGTVLALSALAFAFLTL
ncbi:MAG: hypothetical protein OXR68_04605 [Alphaproteobacteria bacterium]|nr:hypothetical protein [Alphaproteobacteria bacterium]MDD9919889.1 hypothetical protein [Alphaproteobacteria bacterium]